MVTDAIPGPTADRATAFKALGDLHRLAMLMLLAENGRARCVCDLGEHLPLAQPTASHRLKILPSAGLIEREQRGRWAYYSVRPERLVELQGYIGELCD